METLKRFGRYLKIVSNVAKRMIFHCDYKANKKNKNVIGERKIKSCMYATSIVQRTVGINV